MRHSIYGLGLMIAVGLPTAFLGKASAQWAPSTSCDQFGGYELENCLNKALATADTALNDAYKKAEAAIAADSDASADDKKAWLGNLVAAQRAWVAFRDANCKFDLIAAEWDSGSGTTSAQQACVLAATLARTTELQQRYTLSN
ncbi:DUF1311 domain-containing protein [Corticibacterium sp. UT-5YL-CI-8]|nr:DUF1311 domain-containing protein [Tianweitania sp. UT-5YL-CI-8]